MSKANNSIREKISRSHLTFLIPLLFFVSFLSLIFANATTRPVENMRIQVAQGPMDLASYIPYSSTSFSLAQKKGVSVLFFAATGWCTSCSDLDREITERAYEIPEGVTILKVDYDHDKSTVAQWSVTLQHTLVMLDENGEELARWAGGDFDMILASLGSR